MYPGLGWALLAKRRKYIHNDNNALAPVGEKGDAGGKRRSITITMGGGSYTSFIYMHHCVYRVEKALSSTLDAVNHDHTACPRRQLGCVS
jgi:hypothetical protein